MCLYLLKQRQQVHQLCLVLLPPLGLCNAGLAICCCYLVLSHAERCKGLPVFMDNISSCTCSLMLSIMLPSRPSCIRAQC